MEQYIKKSDIVAEIKKTKRFAKRKLKETSDKYWEIHFQGCITACKSILSFLDTLEVKEVDLEKEINKYIYDNFFCSQTLGFFATRTKEEPDDQDIALCAKHFFELGLKAKGE